MSVGTSHNQNSRQGTNFNTAVPTCAGLPPPPKSPSPIIKLLFLGRIFHRLDESFVFRYVPLYYQDY
jgi:hypothetical protein